VVIHQMNIQVTNR